MSSGIRSGVTPPMAMTGNPTRRFPSAGRAPARAVGMGGGQGTPALPKDSRRRRRARPRLAHVCTDCPIHSRRSSGARLRVRLPRPSWTPARRRPECDVESVVYKRGAWAHRPRGGWRARSAPSPRARPRAWKASITAAQAEPAGDLLEVRPAGDPLIGDGVQPRRAGTDFTRNAGPPAPRPRPLRAGHARLARGGTSLHLHRPLRVVIRYPSPVCWTLPRASALHDPGPNSLIYAASSSVHAPAGSNARMRRVTRPAGSAQRMCAVSRVELGGVSRPRLLLSGAGSRPFVSNRGQRFDQRLAHRRKVLRSAARL